MTKSADRTRGVVTALSEATLERVDTADGIDAGIRQALDERDQLRAEVERLRGEVTA